MHAHDTRTCTQLHARTLAHTLTRSTRSLRRPGCCLQSLAVVESVSDACMDDPSTDQPQQSAAAPLFAQQTNNCSKLCPVQWTLQLLVSDAWTDCTGSLIRARLARAGYRFARFSDAQGTPSRRIRVDQRGQAHEQVRRVADPSSQPHAPRRIIGAWWREEGSASERAYSGGDRSHAKGHA